MLPVESASDRKTPETKTATSVRVAAFADKRSLTLA